VGLFGRAKLKEPAAERLFALTTAAVTLEVECGLTYAGKGALVFKPLSTSAFDDVVKAADELLDSVAQDSGSKITRETDSFGYEWVIIADPQLEDGVASVHLLAQELDEQGFGARLLAALFRFSGYQHPVYWVYGYKDGAFWPFVPAGGQERDNAKELELKAKLEPELKIEGDLSKWFGMFDAPL
jgi:hypothetical protein